MDLLCGFCTRVKMTCTAHISLSVIVLQGSCAWHFHSRRPFHACYRLQLLICQCFHSDRHSNGTPLNLEMRFWMEKKLPPVLCLTCADAQTSECCWRTFRLFPVLSAPQMWPKITRDCRPHVCYFMCGSCVPPGTFCKLKLNLSIWFRLHKLCPLLFLDGIQSKEHIRWCSLGPRYLPELSVSLTHSSLCLCSPALIGAVWLLGNRLCLTIHTWMSVFKTDSLALIWIAFVDTLLDWAYIKSIYTFIVIGSESYCNIRNPNFRL